MTDPYYKDPIEEAKRYAGLSVHVSNEDGITAQDLSCQSTAYSLISIAESLRMMSKDVGWRKSLERR